MLRRKKDDSNKEAPLELPNEVWMEILSYVTRFEDQLELRLVCKSWDQLLQDQDKNLQSRVQNAEKRHKMKKQQEKQQRKRKRKAKLERCGERCHESCYACGVILMLFPLTACCSPAMYLAKTEVDANGSCGERGTWIYCPLCFLGPFFCLCCCPCAFALGQYSLWSTSWIESD